VTPPEIRTRADWDRYESEQWARAHRDLGLSESAMRDEPIDAYVAIVICRIAAMTPVQDRGWNELR